MPLRETRPTVGRIPGKKLIVRKDHTIWHVTTGGKVRRIATRKASARAIDEAMTIYGAALKSLANR
jgi:hypothetical protein